MMGPFSLVGWRRGIGLGDYTTEQHITPVLHHRPSRGDPRVSFPNIKKVACRGRRTPLRQDQEVCTLQTPKSGHMDPGTSQGEHRSA